MRLSPVFMRCVAVAFLGLVVSGCEGPGIRKDNSGQTNQFTEWAPIEPAQLAGNLAEALSGLPLKDAQRSLRNNGTVIHDRVTITDRGWALVQRINTRDGYFGIQSFNTLGSRSEFETWVKGRFPQAKEIEILEVLPATHPRIAVRGFAATITGTNQQDQKFRCAVGYAGYGEAKASESSPDIFRLEDFKSTVQIVLCATRASATLMNSRLQRLAF